MTPELMKRIQREILQPVIDGLRQEGVIYKGCLYAGLMIDSAGRVGSLYSRRYLDELERHSPYRFARLKQLRRKVARRFSTEEIVKTIILANGMVTKENVVDI